MTLEEFQQEVKRLCYSVQPGAYFHVEHAAYDKKPWWKASTDCIPSNVTGSEIWYVYRETPEDVLVAMRDGIEKYVWRREVAQAMGVL